MKPSIDNKPPVVPQHVLAKAKRQRMLKERNSEIQEQNRILLKKMLQIDLKLSPLNPQAIIHNHSQPSLNRNFRIREMKKIANANTQILKRLRTTHSVYNIRRWEDDRNYKVYLRDNISRNSGRVPKQPKTFEEDPQEMVANILKRQGSRPKTASTGLETVGYSAQRPKTQGADVGYL
eukprot:CAMPEP_0204900854 /NCGR_PEP_ID=MMETSP1397-20131031/2725_1 /ASSEMBLY_ACC=CAM_ASM_000891 /TAXON_ID=49980 /ORGANISM="Climacostomum Climacostomum virens, Strain Stock W-24" /LENGTH=177 /DNA_ID=CAMNT_0052069085 /DNA_START=106 /DNA_END=636 /DNA_ORIENTATION=-